MLGDSNVTVATGNSRHYQPPRRKERRHRRKSSNLLFSAFFFATLSPPFRTYDILSLRPPSSVTDPRLCWPDTQRPDENGPGPFPPRKEGRKGWPEKMAGNTKESRCPDNPDLSTLPPILSFFSPVSFTSTSSESLATHAPTLPGAHGIFPREVAAVSRVRRV